MKEIIKPLGGKVALQESKMSLVEKIIYKGEISGSAFTMRHDILVELDNNIFVLDTKYKELSRFDNNDNYLEDINVEVKQSDLYQVLEYARKRNIKDVYLLYPMYRYEEREEDFPVAVSESPSGNINVHFIRLPFVFEENEDIRIKNQLRTTILDIFGLQV